MCVIVYLCNRSVCHLKTPKQEINKALLDAQLSIRLNCNFFKGYWRQYSCYLAKYQRYNENNMLILPLMLCSNYNNNINNILQLNPKQYLLLFSNKLLNNNNSNMFMIHHCYIKSISNMNNMNNINNINGNGMKNNIDYNFDTMCLNSKFYSVKMNYLVKIRNDLINTNVNQLNTIKNCLNKCDSLIKQTIDNINAQMRKENEIKSALIKITQEMAEIYNIIAHSFVVCVSILFYSIVFFVHCFVLLIHIYCVHSIYS